MPIARTPSRSRCSRPQLTAIATDRNMRSHDVWNASATSDQLIRFAQRARNQAYVVVAWCLPLPQGTDSTTTPHAWQSTRRMAYTKNTAIPHSGTNSKRRGGSVSYPGRGRAYPEHLVGPGTKLHIQHEAPAILTQMGLCVDEGLVPLDPVEDSLQPYPVGGRGVDEIFRRDPIVSQTPQDAPPSLPPRLTSLPRPLILPTPLESPTDSARDPKERAGA